MRRVFAMVVLALCIGGVDDCNERPPIEYRMLCQPHSSLDGVPYTLDMRLCQVVDRNDCRWGCIDWQPNTVYCECVTTDEVREWEDANGY